MIEKTRLFARDCRVFVAGFVSSARRIFCWSRRENPAALISLTLSLQRCDYNVKGFIAPRAKGAKMSGQRPMLSQSACFQLRSLSGVMAWDLASKVTSWVQSITK
jgi:hypothetical protein